MIVEQYRKEVDNFDKLFEIEGTLGKRVVGLEEMTKKISLLLRTKLVMLRCCILSLFIGGINTGSYLYIGFDNFFLFVPIACLLWVSFWLVIEFINARNDFYRVSDIDVASEIMGEKEVNKETLVSFEKDLLMLKEKENGLKESIKASETKLSCLFDEMTIGDINNYINSELCTEKSIILVEKLIKKKNEIAKHSLSSRKAQAIVDINNVKKLNKEYSKITNS